MIAAARRLFGRFRGLNNVNPEELAIVIQEALVGNAVSQRKYGKYLIEEKYGTTKNISRGILMTARSAFQGNLKAKYYLFSHAINYENHELQALTHEEIMEIIPSLNTGYGRGSSQSINLNCIAEIFSISTDVNNFSHDQRQRIQDRLRNANFGENESMTNFVNNIHDLPNTSTSTASAENFGNAALQQ